MSAETPKQEEPKQETPKQEVPKQEAPKAEEKKPEGFREAKKEKPVNCAVCNKSIKKKRYYYRNGKYYCTKRCWKTTVKKEDKESAEKLAQNPQEKPAAAKTEPEAKN